LGEFDYRYFFQKEPNITILMRSIIILSTIYIIGLLSYIASIYRENIVQKFLFGVFLINLLLIVKFIADYPSVCNSDFRYFVGSFTLIGYIFAKGLTELFFNRYIRYFILGVVSNISILEILFILYITI